MGHVNSAREPQHLHEYAPTPHAWQRIVAWVCGAMALATVLAWWISIGAP